MVNHPSNTSATSKQDTYEQYGLGEPILTVRYNKSFRIFFYFFFVNIFSFWFLSMLFIDQGESEMPIFVYLSVCFISFALVFLWIFTFSEIFLFKKFLFYKNKVTKEWFMLPSHTIHYTDADFYVYKSFSENMKVFIDNNDIWLKNKMTYNEMWVEKSSARNVDIFLSQISGRPIEEFTGSFITKRKLINKNNKPNKE